MTTPIGVIEIGDVTEDAVEVTLRGKAAKVIDVLISGLPRNALEQMRDVLTAEVEKRASNTARRGAERASQQRLTNQGNQNRSADDDA